MAFDTPTVIQLFGASLVVLVGAGVALVEHRSPANRWFTVFAVAFGGQFIVTNLGMGFEVSGAAWYLWSRLVLRAVAVVGAVGLGLTFPARIGQDQRRAALTAAGLTLPIVAVSLATRQRSGGLLTILVDQAWVVLFAALFFPLYIFALRHSGASRRQRTQLELMSAALLLYTGFASGAGADASYGESLFAHDAAIAIRYASYVVALVVLSALWLVNASHSRRARGPSNVGMLALATPLAGMLYVAYLPDLGMLGISRTLAVAVIAYAIVRHQLLGIDVKVRWGISKSTVAAAFITVFFVAGEGAQILFGADNELVGLVAAGALVFALAPLQRFADRVARRAVPAQAAAATESDERLELYRHAAAHALRDGELSEDEKLYLARLAEALGIGAGAAMELRLEEARRRRDELG